MEIKNEATGRELKSWPRNMIESALRQSGRGPVPGELPVDAEGTLAYLLCRLPEKHRDAAEARYRFGRTYGEIAEMLGTDEAGAYQAVARGLRRLGADGGAEMLTLGISGYVDRRCREAARSAAVLEASDIMEYAGRRCREAARGSFPGTGSPERGPLPHKGPGPETGNPEDGGSPDPFMPIGELGLSARLLNALSRSGCRTTGDILNLGLREIAGMRNIGTKCINELTWKLSAQGFDVPGTGACRPDSRALERE